MISVSHLTKCYGRVTAVDDISFEIGAHEIVGFLGPNGAGKTTTLRILSTFLPATAGTVTVAGMDIFADPLDVRRRIGYLPEHAPIYHDMRVGEYLRFRGRLKGLYGSRLRSRVGEVAGLCEIRDVIRTPISHLSSGYRKRVGLADALVHDPEVLILDEPAIGLDPTQIRNLRHLLQELGKRHTVLLSSHILPEVEALCERVLIINHGRIVASDTPANLIRLMRAGTQVEAEIMGPAEAVAAALGALPGIGHVHVEKHDGWLRVTCDGAAETDPREAIFRAVAAGGWSLRHLGAVKRNLEDVFVELIATGGNGAGAAEDSTPAGDANAAPDAGERTA